MGKMHNCGCIQDRHDVWFYRGIFDCALICSIAAFIDSQLSRAYLGVSQVFLYSIKYKYLFFTFVWYYLDE